MSTTVLLIGIAHALPPVVGALMTKSKTGVAIGALVGTIIAFSVGRSAYVAGDLIGVAVGTWIGLSVAGYKK